MAASKAKKKSGNGAPLVHGASDLPSVVVEDYNNEAKDQEGFVGDRARKAAFQEKGVDILGEDAPQVLSRLRRRQGNKFVYDFWQKTSGQNRNVEYTLPVRPLITHLHENPVRRGLVERATDWTWSSAGAYAGRPLAELRPDPVPPELLGP